MQDYGLVSIITPTWNCARFIAETIESVQAQTYRNWEMIIVDDCSTDNTAEVVAPYVEADPRISYHCLERNSGAAVARNTALRLAKGRWIAFLDSDDLWLPEKLEHQLRFMVDNGYSFSSTESESIDEDSKPLGLHHTGPRRVTKFGMYCYCWIGCLTVMYDASVVGLIQIKNISKNNDYAIWLQAIRKTDCYLLKEELSRYRVRKGSISNHGYIKLIKWHYKLWHDADDRNAVTAVFLTAINLVCGTYKKLVYTHRENHKE